MDFQMKNDAMWIIFEFQLISGMFKNQIFEIKIPDFEKWKFQ